ncbi:camp-dependent protein kinase regulatory subunit [Calocera viscosa TUFC12733]|uniref:cAMP-dependent protein kinase regulatory subunit n=1 Tax=Calocera viscosa (strain TUFC12733) TaxID=1330018 RepID=A0A167HZN2_CALVF|nr:camp-dependent protein kinase regulatory subunit [Calocera viscosa TUFC12733]
MATPRASARQLPSLGPNPFLSSFQSSLNSRPRHPMIPGSPGYNPTGFNPNRRGSVSAESITLSEGEQPALPFYSKTPEQLQRIKDSIFMNFLFMNLDPEQEASIFGAFKEVRVQAGDVIIKQGDIGDFFYIVESGKFEIFISSFDEKDETADGEASMHSDIGEIYSPKGYGKLVERVEPGGSFGELALMYNAPRAATVVAVTHSIVWALDRLTFRTILLETTLRKRRMYDQFLSTVPLFKGLSQYERYKIADTLDTLVYRKGDYVIKQGDVGDRFYIIEMGNAAVLKDVTDENGNVDKRVVALYKKGDFFGELALLNDQPRAASVVATGNPDSRQHQDLRVVSMQRDAFERLMGPVEDLMRRQEYSDAPITREGLMV